MAARLCAARATRQLASSTPTKLSSCFVQKSQSWQQAAPVQRRLFSVSSAFKEKQYTEDHEWIELSSDGKTATLGISEYAAKALGEAVYIELPEVDMDVSAGDVVGAIESVKSASDILTPVGGKVVEANSTLEKEPKAINKDPEGPDYWIAKIEVEGKPEGKLMTKDEYTAYTEEV